MVWASAPPLEGLEKLHAYQARRVADYVQRHDAANYLRGGYPTFPGSDGGSGRQQASNHGTGAASGASAGTGAGQVSEVDGVVDALVAGKPLEFSQGLWLGLLVCLLANRGESARSIAESCS